MKGLLLLMILSMSAPLIAGPRFVGNGGGGVKENGVYKTFYSAGLYVAPIAETEIPGTELYTKTILSLAGNGESKSKLFSSALPLGERKFYKILEDKMDKVVMDRLLEEYARVVKQSQNQLTIFAITDIAQNITYLLPSFYKLSEVEQAAIIFHEAYWILNPEADYAEVVAAESAFQKFVERKEAGNYDLGLPHLLGKLLKDPKLPLETAYQEDVRAQNSAGLINKNGEIKMSNLFENNESTCKESASNDFYKRSMFGNSKYRNNFELTCVFSENNLQGLLLLSRKYPQSFFLKELMKYLISHGKIEIEIKKILNQSSEFDEEEMAELKAETLNVSVEFKNVKFNDYHKIIYVEKKY
jgi:hypothetical protein